MTSKGRFDSLLPLGERLTRLSTLCLVPRVIVGFVFCASGILKLVNEHEFAEALTSYGFFQVWHIDLLSVALPLVEIGLGASLLLGVGTRFTSWMLTALLMAFSLAALAAVSQGRSIDCGCFPIEGAKEAIGLPLFIRNGLLMLGCLFIAIYSPRRGAHMVVPVRRRESSNYS